MNLCNDLAHAIKKVMMYVCITVQSCQLGFISVCDKGTETFKKTRFQS